MVKLGDAVEKMLSSVGVTEARVKRWLGGCNCGARKRRLNQLHDAVMRFASGATPEQVGDEVEEMIAKDIGPDKNIDNAVEV